MSNTTTTENRFSNGKWSVMCMTVGEMVAELSRLNPDMPVEEFPSKGLDLVIFNRDQKDEHLSIDEAGMWSEDEE